MKEMSPQMALIAELARRSPGQSIGRTALMKLCYLLQTLRDVPLPYRFTLYAYGPYDKEVLYDLGLAEAAGVVSEQCVPYPSGYGYEIRSIISADDVPPEAQEFLGQYQKDIGWVTEKFGGRTAAQLELVGTIVYADRERAEAGGRQAAGELAETVRAIKPRFDTATIEAEIAGLRGQDLLTSLS